MHTAAKHGQWSQVLPCADPASVGAMPSKVLWTYKGANEEHHGEQRIEFV